MSLNHLLGDRLVVDKRLCPVVSILDVDGLSLHLRDHPHRIIPIAVDQLDGIEPVLARLLDQLEPSRAARIEIMGGCDRQFPAGSRYTSPH